MKRRFVTGVGFLAAGALVNVSVAWGAALLSHSQDSPIAMERALPSWQRYRNASWPEMPLSCNHYSAFGQRLIVSGGYNEVGYFCMVYEVSCGLPFKSMAYAMTLVHDTAVYGFADDLHVPWKIRDIWGRGGTHLPARVLWPGFVMNTLFFAGLLWLVFRGPTLLRRRLRIHRGLCPLCAYPARYRAVCLNRRAGRSYRRRRSG